MRKRISKSIVDQLPIAQTIWDTDVKGFCVRRQLSETRTFALKTVVRGRQTWLTIGRYGSPWTVDQARNEARALLLRIVRGENPAEDPNPNHQPKVTDLCERYLREHAYPNKKKRSARMDESNIRNHVLPQLGTKPVLAIAKADMEAFKVAIKEGRTARSSTNGVRGYRGGALVSGGPGVANACLALLSKMMNLAEQWGWRPNHSNPVRFVAKYPGKPKGRYLSPEEFRRIGEALKNAEANKTESPYAIAAIRLLMLTGARRGEILHLRWEHVDFANGILMLPDSKTGPKILALTPKAIEVLGKIERFDNNPYVIVGGLRGKCLVNLSAPWARISTAAAVQGTRVHDLRHSFASIAAAEGVPLSVIGRLLGHKSYQTTLRYAHLTDRHVAEAGAKVSGRIGEVIF